MGTDSGIVAVAYKILHGIFSMFLRLMQLQEHGSGVGTFVNTCCMREMTVR